VVRLSDSLRTRLLVSGLLGMAIAAAVVAGLLGAAFEETVLDAFDRRLTDDLLTLVGQVTADGDRRARLRDEPHDSRYDRVFSGHYWMVTQPGLELRSRSLWDAALTLPDAEPATDADRRIMFRDIGGPTGQELRSASQLIQIPGVGHPVRVVVASDVRATRDSVSRFRLMAGLAGALVAAGLMLVLFIQAAYGLRPLRHLARALERLRRGDSQRLDAARFPREIRPLADEHNALLAHHERMAARARGAAGDLAHALKTPLSVVLAAAERRDSRLPAIVAEQVARMQTSIDRQLAVTAVGSTQSRTPVAAVADALVPMLASLYADRRLAFQSAIDPALRFHGSREDLEDMLGNLLDNASKWARGRVSLSAGLSRGNLSIDVEDDGPGIAEDQLPRVIERGVRLDERAPGNGLGLSIVATLAASYDGELVLQQAAPTGLRATLSLPGSIAH